MVNNQPLVSIVMPSYNAEKTIDRAIESVLNQTYKNIELVIVNDGSVDGTLKKIREYEDARIKVVNQPNGGLSNARNSGINNASGDYLTFIDSDDWYEETFIEKHLNSSIQNDSQLTVCGMIFHKVQNTQYSKVYDNKFDSFFENEEFLSILESGIMNSTCDKMYDLQTIKNNGLLFKNISILEDLEFNLRYVDYVKSVCFIPCHLYHYDNTSSVLTKKVSTDMFDNYIHLHAWLLSKVPIILFHVASRFVFHQYFSFFVRYARQVMRKQKKLSDIRGIFDTYLSNPLINYSFKVYHSKVWGERVLIYLLWHRYYRILILYMSLVDIKEHNFSSLFKILH